MIHGHTRITLTNPISGHIIKDIESENTFQSTVIAKALRNLGECNASILTNSVFKATDYWKETVGGILLFKNSISADSSFMSSGNTMTANGATDIVNASNPPELGTYNDIESKMIANERKLILQYEWGQSQGNGKISSVCLTSRTGGLIGYGNASGYRKTESDPSDYFTFNRLTDNLGADSGSTATRQAVGVGNYKYTFSCSGSIVTVVKKKICITTASIFDLVSETFTFDLSEVGNPLSWTNQECYVTASEGLIGVVPNRDQGETAVNGKFRFYIYDTTDDSFTLKEMTNTSTNTLYISISRSYGGSYRFGMSHGNVFVGTSGTGTKVEGFKLSDNTHVCSLPITAEGWQMAGNNFMIGDLPNGLTLVSDRETNNNVYDCFIYDTTNGTCYPINSSNRQIQSTLNTSFIYDSTLEALMYNRNGYVTAVNNPLYLATINNITEVIKDATLSMKVRYTLSES